MSTERKKTIDEALQDFEEVLVARGALSWKVTDEFPHGPCGLSVPMNHPPLSAEDYELCAALEHEDSGYGPLLWNYGLAMLRFRVNAREREAELAKIEELMPKPKPKKLHDWVPTSVGARPDFECAVCGMDMPAGGNDEADEGCV